MPPRLKAWFSARRPSLSYVGASNAATSSHRHSSAVGLPTRDAVTASNTKFIDFASRFRHFSPLRSDLANPVHPVGGSRRVPAGSPPDRKADTSYRVSVG